MTMALESNLASSHVCMCLRLLEVFACVYVCVCELFLLLFFLPLRGKYLLLAAL